MNAFAPASLTLEALRTRGEPQLFERDAAVWRERLIAWFEAETNRTLYPDQTEMFLIEMAAYAFATKAEEDQAALIANLIVFSENRHLDDAAANLTVFRLTAEAATVRLRFTLPTVSSNAILVPARTRASAGELVFETVADLLIPAGTLARDVDAVATSAGVRHNGLAPGQITAALGSIASGLTATNVTVSTGGADEETDEHLRSVAVDAAERFDRRGGWGGYGFAVRRINPDITDVAINRPEPGHIHILPLTSSDDPPGETLLDQIRAGLPADTLRPQGDYLTVRAPTPFDVSLVFTLRIDPLADAVALQEEAEANVRETFARFRRPVLAGHDETQFAPETGRLGAQLGTAPLIAAASRVAGVVDVELEGLVFTDLPFDQYPRLVDVAFTLIEMADV